MPVPTAPMRTACMRSQPRRSCLRCSVCRRGGNAADPQPYTVDVAKTGYGPLDSAIHDSLTLISLAEGRAGRAVCPGRPRPHRPRPRHRRPAQLRLLQSPRDHDDRGPADRRSDASRDARRRAGGSRRAGHHRHHRRATVPSRANLRHRPIAAGGAARSSACNKASRRWPSRWWTRAPACRRPSPTRATRWPRSASRSRSCSPVQPSWMCRSPSTPDRASTSADRHQRPERRQRQLRRRRLLLHRGRAVQPDHARDGAAGPVGYSACSRRCGSCRRRSSMRRALPVDFEVAERPRARRQARPPPTRPTSASSLGACWQRPQPVRQCRAAQLGGSATGGGNATRQRPATTSTAQFIKPDFPGARPSLQARCSARSTRTCRPTTARRSTGDALFNSSSPQHWTAASAASRRAGADLPRSWSDRYYTLVGLPLSAALRQHRQPARAHAGHSRDGERDAHAQRRPWQRDLRASCRPRHRPISTRPDCSARRRAAACWRCAAWSARPAGAGQFEPAARPALLCRRQRHRARLQIPAGRPAVSRHQARRRHGDVAPARSSSASACWKASASRRSSMPGR